MFVDITVSMGMDRASSLGLREDDFRREWVSRQLDLLGTSNPFWRARRIAEKGPLLAESGLNPDER